MLAQQCRQARQVERRRFTTLVRADGSLALRRSVRARGRTVRWRGRAIRRRWCTICRRRGTILRRRGTVRWRGRTARGSGRRWLQAGGKGRNSRGEHALALLMSRTAQRFQPTKLNSAQAAQHSGSPRMTVLPPVVAQMQVGRPAVAANGGVHARRVRRYTIRQSIAVPQLHSFAYRMDALRCLAHMRSYHSPRRLARTAVQTSLAEGPQRAVAGDEWVRGWCWGAWEDSASIGGVTDDTCLQSMLHEIHGMSVNSHHVCSGSGGWWRIRRPDSGSSWRRSERRPCGSSHRRLQAFQSATKSKWRPYVNMSRVAGTGFQAGKPLTAYAGAAVGGAKPRGAAVGGGCDEGAVGEVRDNSGRQQLLCGTLVGCAMTR